jgi:hypothetical protein
MDWSLNSRWRAMAVAYLVAFPCMLIGLAWTLICQVVDAGDRTFIPGTILFVLGQLALASIAFAGRHQPTGSHPPRRSEYHWNWLNLTLGRSIGSAFRVATHRTRQ